MLHWRIDLFKKNFLKINFYFSNECTLKFKPFLVIVQNPKKKKKSLNLNYLMIIVLRKFNSPFSLIPYLYRILICNFKHILIQIIIIKNKSIKKYVVNPIFHVVKTLVACSRGCRHESCNLCCFSLPFSALSPLKLRKEKSLTLLYFWPIEIP